MGALKSFCDKNPAESINSLSPSEQYMIAVLKIEQASEKFDCMLFKIRFQCMISEVIVQITKLECACDDIRKSVTLKKLLAIILKLGNYINTGGKGDSGAAFKLESLLELGKARAFDKKTSVLQYLIRLVMQNDMDLLNFTKDIASVGEAERINAEIVSEEVKKLREKVENVYSIVEKVKPIEKIFDKLSKHLSGELGEDESEINDEPAVNIPSPMEKFAIDAKNQIDKVVLKEAEVREKFAKLLKFYGEDPKMMSHDFFSILNAFATAFDVTKDQVLAIEEKKKKDAKKAAAKKKKKKKKKKRLKKKKKKKKKK